MKRNMLLLALLAAPTPAAANSFHFLEVDNTLFGDDPLYGGFNDAGWRTFDLLVRVDVYDDWTSAAAVVHTDGVFFQHAAGGDVEASAGALIDFPALEFDTFFADPPALFDGDQPSFAEGPIWTQSSVEATWYDIDNGSGDMYTIARFTFTGDLWIEGAATFANSDMLWDYEFTTVPAPASATPLLLAAGIGRRRRSPRPGSARG